MHGEWAHLEVEEIEEGKSNLNILNQIANMNTKTIQ